MAPEKLGNSFGKTSMVTPLNAEPGPEDPGPPINNSPVEKFADPLGFLSQITGAKKDKGGK